MEKGRESDQESRATNKECNSNSENESTNKQQQCNSEVGGSFPEEESEEEEAQSKETRLPESQLRTYISDEERSDDYDHDDGDDEREEEEEDEEEEESGEEFQFGETKITKEKENIKNFNDKNERVRAGPSPPPPLPSDFKKCIQRKFQGLEISINDEVLVVQKQLSKYEVNQDQPLCRLHIPSGLLRRKHFNDDELDELSSKSSMSVKIIDPFLDNISVNLSRRIMQRNVGESEPSIGYVLDTAGWIDIVNRKNLEEGDIVQLWAVKVGGNLCFALVKLPMEEGQSSGGAEEKLSSASTKE